MMLLLTGCATKKPYDYSAFRASKPASILVLPADNTSPDINAAHSLTSLVTRPLAEAGYYVFPREDVVTGFGQRARHQRGQTVRGIDIRRGVIGRQHQNRGGLAGTERTVVIRFFRRTTGQQQHHQHAAEGWICAAAKRSGRVRPVPATVKMATTTTVDWSACWSVRRSNRLPAT